MKTDWNGEQFKPDSEKKHKFHKNNKQLLFILYHRNEFNYVQIINKPLIFVTFHNFVNLAFIKSKSLQKPLAFF